MRQWSNQHWFRQWLVAWSAQNHYQNQCWNIVNKTLRNKLQWFFCRNSNIFIQENAFEMSSAKRRPFCLGLNELINSLDRNRVTCDYDPTRKKEMKENKKSTQYIPNLKNFGKQFQIQGQYLLFIMNITNTALLSNGLFRTNFSEVGFQICTFSLTIIYLLSAKLRQFCHVSMCYELRLLLIPINQDLSTDIGVQRCMWPHAAEKIQ